MSSLKKIEVAEWNFDGFIKPLNVGDFFAILDLPKANRNPAIVARSLVDSEGAQRFSPEEIEAKPWAEYEVVLRVLDEINGSIPQLETTTKN